MTSTPIIDRRRLLELGAGALAAPAVLRGGRASGKPVFSLGVASGDPWPDGFVIWTRLAPDPFADDGGLRDPVTVSWRISLDEAFRHVVASGEVVARPDSAHAVNVEVSGLRPDRPYWYQFTALGEQSPVGRARTAPAPNADNTRLKLAVASCAHWELGYFSAYRHMAAEEPDLVLFLGDYIYEYSLGAGRAAEIVRPYGLAEATDLAGYRRRYALHRTDADLQALHAAAACVATWDDHEVQDDYSGVWSKLPEVAVGEFLRRRAAAYQAFCEHMPLRLRAVRREGGFRLYRRLRFGRLADIFVLDGRQYRSRQPCAEGMASRKGKVAAETCADLSDPSRTLLGFDQERWLYDEIGRGGQGWNILAQDLLVAPLRVDLGDGQGGYWTDTWDGFTASRDRLLRAIVASQLKNPVVLSGDYHSFWVNDLKTDFRDPGSATVATEFVGTSITSNGPAYDPIIKAMASNPHIKFFDSRQRGYMLVDIRRDQLETRLMTISDRRDQNATRDELRRFAVANGRPGAVVV